MIFGMTVGCSKALNLGVIRYWEGCRKKHLPLYANQSGIRTSMVNDSNIVLVCRVKAHRGAKAYIPEFNL